MDLPGLAKLVSAGTLPSQVKLSPSSSLLLPSTQVGVDKTAIRGVRVLHDRIQKGGVIENRVDQFRDEQAGVTEIGAGRIGLG